MAIVDPLDEEQIDAELLQELQFFKGPLGVVPNSVKTMAHRPQIARAFKNLNVAVMTSEGQVSAELKRLIGYVTSFVSGCRYCQAHTILGSKRFGSTEERLNDAWCFESSPHFTEAEKAALAFARAAASVPNSVTPEHGDMLRQFWSEEDIVEIMAVVSLFGFLNRWNDSMGSALEDLPMSTAEQYLGGSGWQPGKHGEGEVEVNS